MPQEIRVVKCFKCEVYQSDIVKKAKKWQCKLCGEKQSVLMEFGRGTGKECRLHAQRLNEKRNDTDQNHDATATVLNLSTNRFNDNENQHADSRTDVHLNKIENNHNNSYKRENKWSKFAESNQANEEQNELDLLELQSSTCDSLSYACTSVYSSGKNLLKRPTEERTNDRPSKMYRCDYRDSKENYFDYHKKDMKNVSSCQTNQKSTENNLVSYKMQSNSKWSTFLPESNEN